MKKLIILFLCCIPLAVNAQHLVYESYYDLDKFDDILSSKMVKTIIYRNDSVFIIETKGCQPVKLYRCCYYYGYERTYEGSEHHSVHLVGQVYGYQWTETCIDEYLMRALMRHDDISEDEMSKHLINVTYRVVTDKYTGEFLTDYYWTMRITDYIKIDFVRRVYGH